MAAPSPPAQDVVEDGLSRGLVPGAAIGAVHRGEPAWVATYGQRRAGGQPVDDQTVFQAASLSKPVTAIGILRLVELGHLPLDEDIRSLVVWDIPRHPMMTTDGSSPLRSGTSFSTVLASLAAAPHLTIRPRRSLPPQRAADPTAWSTGEEPTSPPSNSRGWDSMADLR